MVVSLRFNYIIEEFIEAFMRGDDSVLTVHIPRQELFDEETQTFVNIKEMDLQLEHSLISLAKWESKWHIPFLGKEDKTEEQIEDYIRCMTLTQNVNSTIYQHLPDTVLRQIFDYIEDSMTATWFTDAEEKKGGIGKKDVVTAEIIYYWMITLNIPVQFEKWHLSRLLTLIRVINVKNTPSKKMKQKDILAHNRKLNAARRARTKSKG